MNKNIVFVGAGGTGMSNLVSLIQKLGYQNIICVDAQQSLNTQQLEQQGLQVLAHGKYEVQERDIVIYSDIESIVQGPEVNKALWYKRNGHKKRSHICLTYSQFLAEISKRFLTVSVAGSNGKTSTTGLLIHCLARGKNISGPVFALGIVGGRMPNYEQQGYYLNSEKVEDIKHLFEHIFNQKHQLDYSLLKKYLFVVEACEYKNHFLDYDSDYSIVTNTSRDHSDYFLTEEDYMDSFRKFIHHTKKTAILQDKNIQHLESDNNKILWSEKLSFSSDLLIGKYHEYNAGSIYLLCKELQRETENLADICATRKGMGRRMELLKQYNNGSLLYSDYSHHAPALAGNIESLQQKFPDKRITVIFQPHQARRILDGWSDFLQALELADKIIIYKLYTAREDFQNFANHPQASGLDSFQKIGEEFARQAGGEYILEKEQISELLKNPAPDTITVVFSAGDLDREVREYSHTLFSIKPIRSIRI